ncbi:hypothetical protein FGO68_gene942 [Halteria grandinella]|uniref:Uncharacterized protein n=1 Tax=Halteria grandinella TaxID=5974 RepID=A0A8J8P3X7_HALGN|nr:hypothetical protein FGO68_gene942 [Halteria grandinella]
MQSTTGRNSGSYILVLRPKQNEDNNQNGVAYFELIIPIKQNLQADLKQHTKFNWRQVKIVVIVANIIMIFIKQQSTIKFKIQIFGQCSDQQIVTMWRIQGKYLFIELMTFLQTIHYQTLLY